MKTHCNCNSKQSDPLQNPSIQNHYMCDDDWFTWNVDFRRRLYLTPAFLNMINNIIWRIFHDSRKGWKILNSSLTNSQIMQDWKIIDGGDNLGSISCWFAFIGITNVDMRSKLREGFANVWCPFSVRDFFFGSMSKPQSCPSSFNP